MVRDGRVYPNKPFSHRIISVISRSMQRRRCPFAHLTLIFSFIPVMIKGSSGHFLDLNNAELGDLAWLAGGIYIEQNRFPNTVFPRQCYLLIEDEDIRNKVSEIYWMSWRRKVVDVNRD